MYIFWKDRLVTLQEPDNFKTFKIVIDAEPDQFPDGTRDFEGIATFDDKDTAWVSQGALRTMSGRAHDSVWQQAFGAMLDKARPYGWVNESTGDIRAHVEWALGVSLGRARS